MTPTEVHARPLVLLVEDTEDDVFLTRRALRAGGVTNVVVARNGDEALDFVFCRGAYADRNPHQQPRLILLDVNLPKLGGIEVLRHLRATDQGRLLPVVMLSSSLRERDVTESYAAGANSYLQKPVGTSAFQEAMRLASSYWLGLNVPPV